MRLNTAEKKKTIYISMPVILALRRQERLRQEELEFKVSLDYKARSRIKKKKWKTKILSS
jgi:hypothetical protein